MTTLVFAAETGPQQAPSEAHAQQWSCTEWRLSRARGAGETQVRREVGADEVIELELDDGTRLLLAEDQLADYGFTRSRAGEGIEIGPWLQVADAPRRDGAFGWALRSLRLWKSPAGMSMATLAGTAQDAVLQQRLGWYRFGDQAQVVEPLPNGIAATDQPSLLLLHGTLSSTPGSFGGLLQGASLQGLRKLYDDRLYGFEHRTLTDSPLDNALALVAGLPEGLTVDLVTHSRGGLLAELLIRAAAEPASGFSDAHIAAFGECLDPALAAAWMQKLRELRTRVQAKRLRVRRLLRTAAPMRGTTLLSGRLDRWASTFLNLVQRLALVAGSAPSAAVVRAIKDFLLALARQRSFPEVLPGLEAMRPESPWIALLNPAELELSVPTFVIAGDYRGKNLLSWLGDRFTESFYGGANDLVVNTVSMTGGARRSGGLHRKLFHDSDTLHTSYFDREIVRAHMLDALTRGTEAEGFSLIEHEHVEVARGGHKPMLRDKAPIALLLPGITGSHLQRGKDRIWLQLHELLLGKLRKLEIDAPEVSPDGWIDSAYQAFARHLSNTHEVWPCPYDWRLSIEDSGKQFAARLREALQEAEARKQAVHVFAHSMGGLVARWALSCEGLWSRFEDRRGSRLLMLGTPNGGSHSIPWLLMGREKTLRMLGRVDLRHDRRELVELFRRYPGVLQLMPHGEGVGTEFFSPQLWRRVAADLGDAGGAWPVPEDTTLGACARVLERLSQHSLAAHPVTYVAGLNDKDGTIESIVPGAMPEARWSAQGDGRVLWSTGIPSGVTAYYANCAHGDLADYRKAFEGYRELAEQGATASPHLSTEPPATGALAAVSRGAQAAAASGIEPLMLFPTQQELIAAALGGRLESPDAEPQDALQSVRVELVHGSFVSARCAIVVGRYEEETELSGAALALDRLLGGALADALQLGCLPAGLGSSMIFDEQPHLAQPSAIVVGLGRIGELAPGTLRNTLARGIREHVLKRRRAVRPPADCRVDIAAVLVGSGNYGLPIDTAAQALVGAAVDVQAQLKRLAPSACGPCTIGTLRIYEVDEARAEHAAAALASLQRRQSELRFEYDGRVLRGDHGQRFFLDSLSTGNGAQRVVVTAPRGIEAGLEFTAISASARSDFQREPEQGLFVKRMLELAASGTADQPGLSRSLFELLAPNSYKPMLGNLGSLVLNLDERAAGIPWELMRDLAEPADPLATRIEMVRQLVRSPRERAPRAPVRTALVVGDTRTDDPRYPRLPGARAEMESVRRTLERHGVQVQARRDIDGLEMLNLLLTGELGILHVAAHGDWVQAAGRDEDPAGPGRSQVPPQSGVVLGKGLLLTSSQIAKLPSVPELVFLNCCHLGDTSREAPRNGQWPELAASLAVAFIDRGAKVVVAAGWTVDDAAAQTFAEAFYEALMEGAQLASAALAARKLTYQRHGYSNTWGAYQVYGDPAYSLLDRGTPRAPSTLPISTRLAALDALHRLTASQALELSLGAPPRSASAARTRAAEAIDAVAKRLAPQLRDDAEVRDALGLAYQSVGEWNQAIEQWRAALAAPQGTLPMLTLERLANAEIREAAVRVEHAPAAAHALLKSGLERLGLLVRAGGDSCARLCRLGAAHKREAWILAYAPQGRRGPMAALADAIAC
jgi:hypothetical protein